MCSEMKILIQKLPCRTNFGQYCISYCRPCLWNKIVISKNLTFSDSDFLQAFKCELKRFLLSVEQNHLGMLEWLLFRNKSNSHVKMIPLY